MIRPLGFLTVLAALVAVVAPVRAAEDGKIDTAVKKGAEYLDGQFAKGPNGLDNMHGLGGMALAGIALLEAGTKTDSPGLANIIKGLNAEVLAQTQTYQVALCILFYDKLAEKTGDKNYEGVIQVLGVRLYAGMSASGNWGYSTWDNVNQQELVRLADALKQNDLIAKPGEKLGEQPEPKKPDDGFLKPGAKPAPANVANGKMHPEASRQLLNVHQVVRARGRGNLGGGDNSNTQFGLIGLWVAARHGLPAADAFAAIEAHFLKTQSPQDAGWSYSGMLLGMGMANSTPAMTCAGLLGLAVGTGSRNALIAENTKEKPGEPAKPGGDDPFSNPKVKPKAPVNGPGKASEAALMTLGKFLGGTRPNAPGGGRGNFPAGRGEVAVPGIGGLQNFVGSGNAYYLLWSVERVAMAYGLDTIGDVDWYEWGCGFLLPSQTADGSWSDASYGSIVNTSFALLFLTKSNSVRDLSNKIKGKVRDPGKAELRAGAGATPALFAPPPKEGSKTEPKIDPKTAGPAFTLPAVVAPNEQAEIEKVSTALTTATDETWQTKLDEARDAKGSKWTRGLVAACNSLEAEKKQQAREALAERLTRMTSKTLREMLADSDAELRRAACLAAGMKEDKLLIPALIERITDPADSVVRAAKASLKSISQADFGPPVGADDDAKLKAAATWRSWFEALPK